MLFSTFGQLFFNIFYSLKINVIFNVWSNSAFGHSVFGIFRLIVFLCSVIQCSVIRCLIFRRSVIRRPVFRRSVIRRSVTRRSVIRRSVIRRPVFRRSVGESKLHSAIQWKAVRIRLMKKWPLTDWLRSTPGGHPRRQPTGQARWRRRRSRVS